MCFLLTLLTHLSPLCSPLKAPKVVSTMMDPLLIDTSEGYQTYVGFTILCCVVLLEMKPSVETHRLSRGKKELLVAPQILNLLGWKAQGAELKEIWKSWHGFRSRPFSLGEVSTDHGLIAVSSHAFLLSRGKDGEAQGDQYFAGGIVQWLL